MCCGPSRDGPSACSQGVDLQARGTGDTQKSQGQIEKWGGDRGWGGVCAECAEEGEAHARVECGWRDLGRQDQGTDSLGAGDGLIAGNQE